MSRDSNFVLLCALICNSCIICSCTNYCAIHKEHLFCNDGSFGPRCEGTGELYPVTPYERSSILRAHNEFRNLVASGGVSAKDGQLLPPAADMNELKWDDELALAAEAFVKKCYFEHSCIQCLKLDRFYIGENLQMTGSYGNFDARAVLWKDMIGGWRDEVKDFPSHYVDSLGVLNDNNGHVAQAMWAESRLIGCAKVKFRRSETGETFSISACHYGPNGNVMRSRVYRRGRPATQCGISGRPSKTYPFLCDPSPDLALNDRTTSSTRPVFPYVPLSSATTKTTKYSFVQKTTPSQLPPMPYIPYFKYPISPPPNSSCDATYSDGSTFVFKMMTPIIAFLL